VHEVDQVVWGGLEHLVNRAFQVSRQFPIQMARYLPAFKSCTVNLLSGQVEVVTVLRS
jgi:hypothetical protein